MSPLTLELLNLALKKYHDHTVSAFEKMNVADHVMRQLLPELLNQLEAEPNAKTESNPAHRGGDRIPEDAEGPGTRGRVREGPTQVYFRTFTRFTARD
jgi:hypothetical protein